MKKYIKIITIFAIALFICSGCVTTNLKTSSPYGTELSQSEIDSNLAEAKGWLEQAQRNNGDREKDILYMTEALEKADASLEDIGTTAEKVIELLIAGYEAEAAFWLRLAIEKTGDSTEELGYCVEALSKAIYVTEYLAARQAGE
jgi:hypothetical protein